MGWSKWFGDGTGESMKTKTEKMDNGGTKENQMRTNNGSTHDHQHSYQKYDSSGKLTGGGATPGKTQSDYDRQQKKDR